MNEIWRKDDGKWSTIGPSGFGNEGELHQQIVEAPQLLPIVGQRRIVAPFSEVGLRGGSADVLAFTDKGRPVIIEVKLSKNPEAKRAVVAQTLGYAAWLHGVTVEDLEEDILSQHLGDRKLADVIEETDANSVTLDREGFDRDEFYENLARHLAEGSFRLVIVLDEAPEYLVRLMGYLETITTDRISIDLVTVSAYEVNGTQILVPQRIDTDRETEPVPATPASHRRRSSRGPWQGADRFREWLDELDDDADAGVLRKVLAWADGLVDEGACRVESRRRGQRKALALKTLGKSKKVIAALDNHHETGAAQLWIVGPAIAECAPNSLPALSQATGREMQEIHRFQGHVDAITDELLDALAEACREAAGR